MSTTPDPNGTPAPGQGPAPDYSAGQPGGYQQPGPQGPGGPQSYPGGPPPAGPPPAYGQPYQTQPRSDDNTIALLIHLSQIIFGLIGPLVGWLVYKDTNPYLRAHSAAAFNFSLTASVGMAISIPLIFVVIGIFTATAIGIAYIVFAIMAAIAANRGEIYNYPLPIRALT